MIIYGEAMNQSTINHLLTILAHEKPFVNAPFLNNLIYYTPRIKSPSQLVQLVSAIFESDGWLKVDLLDLYDMSQAILHWKLEISEPVISLSEFFSVWDSCFARCQSWTPQKLAILGGILSTKEEFISLQTSYYLDDTGEVGKFYSDWRRGYFMPTWHQFIQKSSRNIDRLVLIYAMISEPCDDFGSTFFYWDTTTLSLFRSFTKYLVNEDQENTFVGKHLNKLAGTLQISISKSSSLVVSRLLSHLCTECYNLSTKELASTKPKRNYTNSYYSNILFTIIIALKATLQGATALPTIWYYQIIMCLFYVNFITEDVGTIGFESYESVYDIASTGITMCDDRVIYRDILDTMNGNIWKDSSCSNKVNRAKLLFLLNFMGKTLSDASNITPEFIERFLRPLQLIYFSSSEEEIRESMHVATLSLFNNSISGDDLIEWQGHHYLEYISLSTDHFMSGKLSAEQLVLIYQKMSSRLPLLQVVDRHLSRDVLHYTYLRIINCKSNQTEQQMVLLKCLIYQIPYSNEQFLVNWLETCMALISDTHFRRKQQEEIIDTLWEVISYIKSDSALKWWYTHISPLQSRL